MAIDNVTLYNSILDSDRTLQNMMSKGTQELFTERGFQQVTTQNIAGFNKFIETTLRIAFQKFVAASVNVGRFDSIIETYGPESMGGLTQRMYGGEIIEPVTPGFQNLNNGDSPDPFVFRKKNIKEKLFPINFDYQNLISIQEVMLKQYWIDPFGLSAFISACMTGLENAYRVAKETTILNLFDVAITSALTPLKDEQKLAVASWHDEITEADLKSFVSVIQNLKTSLDVAMTAPWANASGFDTAIPSSEMVLVVKAGIMNALRLKVLAGIFNPEMLNIPFTIVETNNYGGITYAYDKSASQKGVRLYPVYDSLGVRTGWSETEGGEPIAADKKVYAVDPHEDILAVVAQKGVFFFDEKNPIRTDVLYNPRGLYNNYWNSAPQNTAAYDSSYGFFTISKPQA